MSYNAWAHTNIFHCNEWLFSCSHTSGTAIMGKYLSAQLQFQAHWSMRPLDFYGCVIGALQKSYNSESILQPCRNTKKLFIFWLKLDTTLIQIAKKWKCIKKLNFSLCGWHGESRPMMIPEPWAKTENKVKSLQTYILQDRTANPAAASLAFRDITCMVRKSQ